MPTPTAAPHEDSPQNPALPEPPRPWKEVVLRQVMLVLVLTLVISTALVIVFHQDWRPTLIYTFFITAACSGFSQGLRHALAWLRWRAARAAGRSAPHPTRWPGWPIMIASLLIGTFFGYSLGVELANLVTGFQERGLLNSSLRRIMTVMVISLIPGFAMTFFFIGRSRIAQAEARAESLRRQAAETQLRLLESQLEPHMLFNTLANLRVLVGMDPARAQAMLDHLIDFLRATLSGSRVDRHPLRAEFERLADYLALMQVRMGSRLRFEFDLPPALAELPVPPLLLQPLVENAIKHGLEAHIGGGLLHIAATLDEAALILTVADNGRGLDPAATPSPGGGFGTTQVRERLTVSYGPQARLTLSPGADGGTLASIHIPREALMPSAAR